MVLAIAALHRTIRAIPKSPSLIRRSGDPGIRGPQRMFFVLMSRWMVWAWWRWRRARRSWMSTTMTAMVQSSLLSGRFQVIDRSPNSAHSMTRKMESPSSKCSSSLMMFGCRVRESRWASWMASRRSSREQPSSLVSLRMTFWVPYWRWVAR
jgi:hypothetical protein